MTYLAVLEGLIRQPTPRRSDHDPVAIRSWSGRDPVAIRSRSGR